MYYSINHEAKRLRSGRMKIILGKWSEDELDRLIRKASEFKSAGARIEFISGHFLGTQYKEATLIGDIKTPEDLAINLEGVDCLTFIDYMEAMRLSGSFSEFPENLKRVRYRHGRVSYEERNHFFTDWREFNSNLVEDITGEIGGDKSRHIKKALNKKGDGAHFLPGISCREREITYISSESADDLIGDLKTGDYAGIYSETDGLDVSHAGIIIRKDDAIYLRHASSVKRRVLDEDFRRYIMSKPGIIVLRPK